jgi:hypothetical protein
VEQAPVLHLPHDVASDVGRTNRNNKRYLHEKFQLPETERFMTTSSLVMNSVLA